MKKVCIIDYGLGNIRSLYNSIRYLGYRPEFFSETHSRSFDVIFIPGIGSFSKASKLLINSKFEHFINDSFNKSLIFGICLGMQIFFSRGTENGNHKGLDLIDGQVDSLEKFNSEKKIILPLVGLKTVYFKNDHILEEFNNKKFYFIHSFAAKPSNEKYTNSYCKIDQLQYCASVRKDRLFGTQFHPEKSGQLGLEFLKKVITNF